MGNVLCFALALIIITADFMVYFFRKEGQDENLVDKLYDIWSWPRLSEQDLEHRSILWNRRNILGNPNYILKVWEGGLASHGASNIDFALRYGLYA